ncbi:hypothetical protein PHYBLDRAFT_68710 [Phycomyces blakesleeanus NRRL 1555(-)]|uniref:Uncharacterized protein n=1 Tax=Phycomyces blakesleeanus (strain ATCC 8743b / DSM 1359 / FGSC 10004 / NBRC 33097 / NRRL 1555) TaxID=763407 RepID=A0A162U381_PHYB8|nr:hypothetical protein PHYBLDRAFT_68710 [Phycomyces blakesleeanus NRRL 1555(-)]OAD72013.1 hypothetical protein PHYBLDRAFT_68710 [Phycomyces blakesleeanus NRRL 1555(-)]|eukprot:XP_018290053.1 hypothetical protein PHYBLDRAFT_68710 [Phycomyces blakesleeanus NRRL 1555(-)]
MYPARIEPDSPHQQNVTVISRPKHICYHSYINFETALSSLLWWLKLKNFLRGRIEDLRLGTKIRENLCRFCLLRKICLNEVLTSKVNVFMSYNYAYNNPLKYLILW